MPPTILTQLKHFIYFDCLHSDYYMNIKMEYMPYNDNYLCFICNKRIPFGRYCQKSKQKTVRFAEENFDEIKPMQIKWHLLKQFILQHKTSRKVIKIFLCKILNEKYDEPYIDFILHLLRTQNKFQIRKKTLQKNVCSYFYEHY